MNSVRHTKSTHQGEASPLPEDYPQGPYRIMVEAKVPEGTTVRQIVASLQKAYDKGAAGHFEVQGSPTAPDHTASIAFLRSAVEDFDAGMWFRYPGVPFGEAAVDQLATEFRESGADDAITAAVIEALGANGRVLPPDTEVAAAESPTPTNLRREAFSLAPKPIQPETLKRLSLKYLDQTGPREGQSMQDLANDLQAHLGGALRVINKVHIELDEHLETAQDLAWESTHFRTGYESGFQAALRIIERHHSDLGNDLIGMISGR